MSSQRTIFLAYLLSISCIFSGGNIVRAENTSANPLDAKIERSDPVIPAGYGKRELSSFEKYRITKAINELDRSARIKLEQGKEDAAFKLWYRRLKLSRALDIEAEITALGDIGAIAWKENRGEDLRNIADRLTLIQDKLTSQESLSPDLLSKFATAYQQTRYLDKAVNIYQQILVKSREQDDAIAERRNLAKLGELYLARFDDRQAAKIYQELLSSTDSQREPKLQTTYLDTLIDIYDRTSQTNNALKARKRLLELYAKSQPNKLAGLEIAIAGDYKSLNQPQRAIEAYERAFNIAFSAQRFAAASDALTQLGKLYRETDSIRAIATYLKLLKIQQQSYDRYGAIDTYDTLGKIHLDLGQKAEAQQYFERGLKLAESLNHKVKYFRDRIDSLRESNPIK